MKTYDELRTLVADPNADPRQIIMALTMAVETHRDAINSLLPLARRYASILSEKGQNENALNAMERIRNAVDTML